LSITMHTSETARPFDSGVQLATPSEYIRIINISPIDFSMNVVVNYSGTKIVPFMRKNFTLKFHHRIVSDIHKTGRNIH